MKKFGCLLTQTETSAPVANSFENTVGEISFEYSHTGLFYAKSDGLFKGLVIVKQNHQRLISDGGDILYTLCAGREDDNTIFIHTMDESLNDIDGVLINQLFEIEIHDII
jgi:hypothetical protein